MKWLTKYAYGSGHVMNDMAGSLEIAYLLMFYLNVIELSPVNAGIILSVGQISCGISAILVGVLIDQKPLCKLCLTFGKRKVHGGY